MKHNSLLAQTHYWSVQRSWCICKHNLNKICGWDAPSAKCQISLQIYFGGRFLNLPLTHIHWYLPLHCVSGLHMGMSQEVLQNWGEEPGQVWVSAPQQKWNVGWTPLQQGIRCHGKVCRFNGQCWGEDSMAVSHHSPVDVQRLSKMNHQQKLMGLCLSPSLFMPVTNSQKNKN